jgi:L-lysine exporter family protein LysE/ArgO
MFVSFIEGFLLGVGAALPLGPINILIMNRALKDYPSAVSIGFGALSADLLYLTLILFGVISLFNNPIFLTLLGSFGALFLFYLAYLIFKGRHQQLEVTKQAETQRSLLKYYLQGFILTFINPYTVAFWLSIAGYTATKELDAGVTIVGMLCAIILWITLMPYAVHLSKHRFSQKVSYGLSLFSSLLLFGFGISLFSSLLID